MVLVISLSERASAVYKLIIDECLNTIPDGDAIDGWSKTNDGFTYITECVDSTKYSFKCYLSPSGQGSLKEAMILQTFVDDIDHLLKLQKKYKIFSASVPFWCYTNGTPQVTCRKK
jgi:hypothetical protein